MKICQEVGICYHHTSTNTEYSGQVDCGVGFVSTPAQPKFYSCLLVSGIPKSGCFGDAQTELLGYMACIRARRIELGRKDITVYGAVTNGSIYMFVELQASGRVRLSDLFSIRHELTTIVTTFTFILEQAANTPEKEDLDDDVIELGGVGLELPSTPIIPA